jgi:hypothetical protein
MRLAEREITEIDKKQQSTETAGQGPSLSSSSSLLASVASAADLPAGKSATASGNDSITMQERMQELIKQISDEARRLAATRAELQKTKKMHAEAISEKVPVGGKKGTATEASQSETVAAEASNTTHRGQQKLAVPEHLMPELCK